MKYLVITALLLSVVAYVVTITLEKNYLLEHSRLERESQEYANAIQLGRTQRETQVRNLTIANKLYIGRLRSYGDLNLVKTGNPVLPGVNK